MLLKIGSTGEDVKKLQTKLGLNADGSFGPMTETKVKEWQAANGLTADGIVGDGTWGKMFPAAPLVIPASNFKLDKLTNIKKDINSVDFKLKSRNKYLIVSDSEFWINVITKWTNSWIKKFIICEKKNLDLIILINYYMHNLYDNGIEIVFQHVNGHADKNKEKELNFYEKGNIMADKLANLGHKNKDLLLKIV